MPTGIYNRKLAKSNKGMFKKGHKLSEKTRKKMGKARKNEWKTGKRKGYKHSKKHNRKKGRIVSKATRKKVSKSLTGSKHFNWKGGLTPLMERIRKCFKYRQWRSDVFTRDDFTCQDCGERGGYLEAHHIDPFAKIIRRNKIKTLEQALACEELWNINNGETLCKECHI